MFFCILPFTLTAQVTIGSANPPEEGALLQLKENENLTNTTRGLLLPRVELTDLNKLYPMLQPSYSPTLNMEHQGLIVFNTNASLTDGTGLYVWDGEKWNKLKIN